PRPVEEQVPHRGPAPSVALAHHPLPCFVPGRYSRRQRRGRPGMGPASLFTGSVRASIGDGTHGSSLTPKESNLVGNSRPALLPALGGCDTPDTAGGTVLRGGGRCGGRPAPQAGLVAISPSPRGAITGTIVPVPHLTEPSSFGQWEIVTRKKDLQ